MAIVITTALLPVFVVLALGYFAGRRKLVDNTNISSLNTLLMQFALPLNLFIAIAKTPRAAIFANGSFAAVIVLTLVLTYLPTLVLARRVFRLAQGEAAVQALTTSFPNFASMGLPVLTPIFGASAALPVAIGITAGAITISPLTIALLEIAKADSGQAAGSPVALFLRALGRALRRPIFLGPAVGVLVAALGLTPPPLLAIGLMPLTACTAGVGLFLTGLILSAQPIRLGPSVAWSVLINTILQPLLALGLAIVFALPPQQRTEVVLLAALPCGFFGLVFGASFGVRSATAGSTLLFASLSSAVTLAAVLWLSA
jgi:malonate transporter